MIIAAVTTLLVCWRPRRWEWAWACIVVELFAQPTCIASEEVAEPERDGFRRARWRTTKEPSAAW